MEERKRPANYDHEDSAPPHKKQLTSVNGGSKSHVNDDLPGKDELERFQKEAIWRQMQEYKRERSTLESRLTEVTKRATYHDDHLRAVDVWFSQLLDEVRLSAGKVDQNKAISTFPSTLLSAENVAFAKHLKSRSAEISSAISQLFTSPAPLTPDMTTLQSRISHLLSVEKNHINELEKSRLEKEQLEERLESASMRYMVAEKKLDRAKSMTVAKLERQALAGGMSEAGSGLGGGIDGQASGKGDLPNGQPESAERLAEIEEARKVAVAASGKQKEQLGQLEAENEKLTQKLTALNIRMSHLGDDDYARTDLFKLIKSQHEDVIKRINDLEATNIQLREEATKLQAERTAYRVQLESEAQATIAEKEAVLARLEADLARVRSSRDELQTEVAMRKATQDPERISVKQVQSLAAAKEERIKALESEIERSRIHAGQVDLLAISGDALQQLPIEELQTKYSQLNQTHTMLTQELSSMQSAYQKACTIAKQKVHDSQAVDEKINRLTAEKSKSEQKYFGAMRHKDSRDQEVRTLRAQNSKSSDIISQLKDAESSARGLLANLEKNIAEAKDALNNLSKQYRTSQQQVSEKTIFVDGFKSQVEELKKTLTTKDASYSTAISAQRKAEVEVEELQVKLEETKKSMEMWKTKGLGNQSGEYEMLRNLALCTVCRKNFKDTAIKTCGHVFCKDCVQERLGSRMRKCPNCNKAFGISDHMHITM